MTLRLTRSWIAHAATTPKIISNWINRVTARSIQQHLIKRIASLSARAVPVERSASLFTRRDRIGINTMFWLTKDYWKRTDRELADLATKYSMELGGGPAGAYDRDFVIKQLVARDTAISNRVISLIALALSVVALIVSIVC